MGLEVIINEFPPEMHIPIQHLVDWMQANQGVSKQDFSELKQSQAPVRSSCVMPTERAK